MWSDSEKKLSIYTLEIEAALRGLQQWCDALTGRRVLWFIDNQVALV